MKKSERMKHYKFLDEFIEKNWDDIEIRIMLKEAENNYFKNR